MSLPEKRVAQINIKSNTDVFLDLWRQKPHHIKHLSPDIVQDCKLHDGEFGSVGSVIAWHYFLDEKYRVAKQIITEIDEEKKLMSFKMIGGDLMELYKAMQITIQVERSGDDNLVTWTVEYEKLDESFPDPDTFMEMFIKLTKDIEAGHLNLYGKRMVQIDIKHVADVFHELMVYRPDEIKHLTPLIHTCYVHEGEFGHVGSVIIWHYLLDGKDGISKQIITEINEEKKLISLKLIEGDLMELYKDMLITFHVERVGDDDLVTWTVEYEKLNESVPDPDTLLDFWVKLTKDIESEHLKK